MARTQSSSPLYAAAFAETAMLRGVGIGDALSRRSEFALTISTDCRHVWQDLYRLNTVQ